MRTTIVTQDNIKEFLPFLTSDEIFAVMKGRLTCFITFTDTGSGPAGIMTARIFPDFIRLERLFIDPEFIYEHPEAELLDIIKYRPENARIPIFAFFSKANSTGKLLLSSGFHIQECSYSVVSGFLEDLVKLHTDDRLMAKFSMTTIDKIPSKSLIEYIQKKPHDRLLQFPEGIPEPGRFSDASPVCLKNGGIQAVLLLEDFEDCTMIDWIRGENRPAILACLAMAKKELEQEFGPGYTIKCLCPDEETENIAQKIFEKSDSIKVQMYRYD